MQTRTDTTNGGMLIRFEYGWLGPRHAVVNLTRSSRVPLVRPGVYNAWRTGRRGLFPTHPTRFIQRSQQPLLPPLLNANTFNSIPMAYPDNNTNFYATPSAAGDFNVYPSLDLTSAAGEAGIRATDIPANFYATPSTAEDFNVYLSLDLTLSGFGGRHSPLL